MLHLLYRVAASMVRHQSALETFVLFCSKQIENSDNEDITFPQFFTEFSDERTKRVDANYAHYAQIWEVMLQEGR